MIVGVPKEVKAREYRVGLTPSAVREVAAVGARVIVETGAGAAVGFSDAEYERAGASIAATAAEVFGEAGLIVKVKEPQPVEIAMLREGQLLFTFLHLAPDREQTVGLLESGVTAIAYETVTDDAGGLPLLAPMSAIAGRMAVQAGAQSLEMTHGGRGTLLAGAPGVEPARVTVIGGGTAGTNAARLCAALGAETVIIDSSLPRLRVLDEMFLGRVETVFSNRDNIARHVAESDLIVCAALVPGAAAPKLIGVELVQSMMSGAAIVDISIDQGGCVATSRPTTHDAPTFVLHGVVHYCVANMPGAVARTSTTALSNATTPFVVALAASGVKALKDNPHLLRGLNIHRGEVTHRAVSEALGLAFRQPEEALFR